MFSVTNLFDASLMRYLPFCISSQFPAESSPSVKLNRLQHPPRHRNQNNRFLVLQQGCHPQHHHITCHFPALYQIVIIYSTSHNVVSITAIPLITSSASLRTSLPASPYAGRRPSFLVFCHPPLTHEYCQSRQVRRLCYRVECR